jgi:hypothetical protein
MPVWPHGDPRDVARSLLRDRRFGGQTSDKKPEPTLWDRILGWIGDRLSEIFNGIGHVLGSNNPWNVALAWAVSIGIALGFIYLVYRLVSSYALSRGESPRRGKRAGYSLESRQSGRELRSAALAAAQAGRYREAAALLFGSAIQTLDELGRVPYDAARTPGEYRRIVRNHDFDVLAGGAVVAIFASAEPQADAFERMSNAYDAFLHSGVA